MLALHYDGSEPVTCSHVWNYVKYQFSQHLALLTGMIWEWKSGSVPFILWGHLIDAVQIIMILLMCGILILKCEVIYRAVDIVFLVHFLRQMQILYLLSYLRRSQVRFSVQFPVNMNQVVLLILHPLGAFLCFWRDNWRITQIWVTLFMCLKDSTEIEGTYNSHETLNIWAETSFNELFLNFRSCLLFFHFIK